MRIPRSPAESPPLQREFPSYIEKPGFSGCAVRHPISNTQTLCAGSTGAAAFATPFLTVAARGALPMA